MVYRGVPSKACSRCRQRKLRCSQQDPQCSQCVNAGVECSGYRDQLELMFLDESASVIEKATRSNTTASRSTSRSGSTSRTAKNSTSPSRSSGTAAEPSVASRPKRLFDLDTDFIGDIFGRFGGFGGDENVDPFTGMATAIQSDRRYLTQYYTTDNYPILVPLGRGAEEVRWVPSVIADPMIFYYALWKTSIRFAILNPEDSTVEADVVRYYQKTVSLLNERLRDPSSAVSDETVKVVLGLVSKAIAERNASEATIHITGLRRMLSHAGPQELNNISPRLQEAVFWHDLCYTAAFTNSSTPSSPPLSPQPHTRSTISTLPLLTYFSPHCSMATLGSGFQFLPRLSSSPACDSLLSLLSDLRSLTVVAEFTASGPENSSPASAILTERHSNADHALRALDLDGDDASSGDSGNHASLLKSIRIAALVFTTIALQYSHPSAIPLAWLAELRALLEDHDRHTASADKQTRELAELRTWLLFTGCVACLPLDSDGGSTTGGELREWFFGTLAQATVHLGVASEAGLRAVLVKFLWVESRMRRFGEFWGVVEGML